MKKKTKDKARSKVNDPGSAPTESTAPSIRNGRGRGNSDGPRAARGRTTDRGRGPNRGTRAGAIVNGSKGRSSGKGPAETSLDSSINASANETSLSWEAPTPNENAVAEQDRHDQDGTTSPDASWELVTPVETAPPLAAEAQKSNLKLDGTRSWASTLFAKPKPPNKASHAPLPREPEPEQLNISELETAPNEERGLPPPVLLEEPLERPETPASSGLPPSEQATNITPSKDELTATNLERVLDASNPPQTATAASTVASTAPGSATPLNTSQKSQASMRPGLGGFATSAYKATSGSSRATSFQRRVLEQQEAVVMPGKQSVDRAAVQFGSLGLNGSTEDLDVDDEREEAETRTQPPQHSPVAPRAALPPAPPQPLAESIPTPRQAPGLPPAVPQPLAHPQHPLMPDQVLPAPATHANYAYQQFNNRFGPSPSSTTQAEAPIQKAYEPFGQQIQQPTTHSSFDSYCPVSQAPNHQAPQSSSQSQLGAYSTAAHEYSSFYTTDNQRNTYQNYYGNSYGQPSQLSQPHQHDASGSQPRAENAFASSLPEPSSQYTISQGQQPSQNRYVSGGTADTRNSSNSTPNPAASQHGPAQGQPAQGVAQQPSQGQAGGQHGVYPYGHPYSYNSPYYSSYMNQVSHHSYGRDRPMFDDVRRYDDQYLTHNHQFGYGGNQGGYGSGPYGGTGAKQSMYGQPHQGYGMSPQTSYDQHSASPANVGGYGQQAHSVPGRDAAGGSLGGYGRTGSTQPESQQHSGASAAFTSIPDVFARAQAGYHAQQPSGQQAGGEETSRSYGDSSKLAGGPSPAPGPPGVRPGSATNPMQSQSGLAASQGQNQPGYGNYPSQMNHQPMHGQASQYSSGLGGLGSHHQSAAQNHQGSGYSGGYGAGFGGNYYGNNNRGGWAGNFGH